MKRLLTLLVLVLCSCAETFVGEEIARPNNANLPDLTATFADEEATRTYIEEGKYLRWNEDDRLTAFYGNTLNRQYKFNGATGDNSGTFSLVPSGELGTGNTLDAIYAIYPYDENASITDSGVISLTLPAEQNYAENSFGRGANTMLAVTENLEDTFLAFKNACGYLKLRLYNAEGASIKSIEVKGNSGERLAGAATATFAFGETPILAMADDATVSVTLDCGEGVALGTTAETATEFWVVLPATTFAEGLTITATDAEGNIFRKSTTKEVVIERNAIQPMAVLEAKFVATKPANNEIWYTNGSTTNKSLPQYIRFGGATIVSNNYDASKECWVITFSDEVTEIGNSVFKQCSSLASVTIPDSVTEIGDYAFQYCSNLSSVTIGNSVNSIGMYAFFECSSLSSVTIPNSVTEIKGHSFAYCSSLSSVTIGGSVTSIGYAAFRECSNLSSVTIPDSVTEIGDEAFMVCSNLSSVTIGNSVNSIGVYAFNRCSSLAEFKGKFASEDGRCLIVNGVLYSFAPAGLTAYTIPDSVTEIGDTAFRDCSNLSSVNIPDNVTEIGDEAFDLCSNLSSVTIPDSVTSIGDTAFGRCSSLASITIPNSVTEIGGYAFSQCSSLSSITIPDGVTSIANCTFYNCLSLASVTIGDSVTSIGHAAFYNCNNLTSVYCKPATPPTVSSKTFSLNASGYKIYVPMGSVEAYKSASYWSDYAYAIVGYDFENGEVVTDNKILYTSLNGNIVTPRNTDAFGAIILSNTYIDGQGVITFDKNVKTIGDNAFSGCDDLESITIPDVVTTIGSSAFAYCEHLVSVTIGDSVTTIGDSAFYDCENLVWVTIGDSVTTIGSSAFKFCNIRSVTIPDSVTTIGSSAFQGCSLTSLTIPDGVTAIGGSAFYQCTDLTSVTIGDSVTTIGNSAFYDCSSLTSVTIPDSVTTIGERAFSYCSNLYKFKGKFAEDNGNILVVDGSIVAFAPAGFTKYAIPEGVTTIGSYAFAGCDSLEGVTIPDSVTMIGKNAFYNCTDLTSITIPDSVTTIGEGAFYNCTDLTSVYCMATTPPVLRYHNVFRYNGSARSIYVPTESVEAYKTAEYWSAYASYIVGYNF